MSSTVLDKKTSSPQLIPIDATATSPSPSKPSPSHPKTVDQNQEALGISGNSEEISEKEQLLEFIEAALYKTRMSLSLIDQTFTAKCMDDYLHDFELWTRCMSKYVPRELAKKSFPLVQQFLEEKILDQRYSGHYYKELHKAMRGFGMWFDPSLGGKYTAQDGEVDGIFGEERQIYRKEYLDFLSRKPSATVTYYDLTGDKCEYPRTTKWEDGAMTYGGKKEVDREELALEQDIKDVRKALRLAKQERKRARVQAVALAREQAATKAKNQAMNEKVKGYAARLKEVHSTKSKQEFWEHYVTNPDMKDMPQSFETFYRSTRTKEVAQLEAQRQAIFARSWELQGSTGPEKHKAMFLNVHIRVLDDKLSELRSEIDEWMEFDDDQGKTNSARSLKRQLATTNSSPVPTSPPKKAKTSTEELANSTPAFSLACYLGQPYKRLAVTNDEKTQTTPYPNQVEKEVSQATLTLVDGFQARLPDSKLEQLLDAYDDASDTVRDIRTALQAAECTQRAKTAALNQIASLHDKGFETDKVLAEAREAEEAAQSTYLAMTNARDAAVEGKSAAESRALWHFRILHFNICGGGVESIPEEWRRASLERYLEVYNDCFGGHRDGDFMDIDPDF